MTDREIIVAGMTKSIVSRYQIEKVSKQIQTPPNVVKARVQFFSELFSENSRDKLLLLKV